MKSNIYPVVAALFAAGTLSMAGANNQPAAPNKDARSVTGTTVPADARTYAAEPIASTVTPAGPNAEIEAAIVQALNADESLKGAKIAVAAEDDKVLLTGASMTKAQREKATEIAVASAGEAKVVNIILPSEA